jgi:hypothetical protein
LDHGIFCAISDNSCSTLKESLERLLCFWLLIATSWALRNWSSWEIFKLWKFLRLNKVRANLKMLPQMLTIIPIINETYVGSKTATDAQELKNNAYIKIFVCAGIQGLNLWCHMRAHYWLIHAASMHTTLNREFFLAKKNIFDDK